MYSNSDYLKVMGITLKNLALLYLEMMSIAMLSEVVNRENQDFHNSLSLGPIQCPYHLSFILIYPIFIVEASHAGCFDH